MRYSFCFHGTYPRMGKVVILQEENESTLPVPTVDDFRAFTWHPQHAGCQSQHSTNAHQQQATQPWKEIGPASCLRVCGL